MKSIATSVEQYLGELPAQRRELIELVRARIRENLDPEFEEGIQYGMIGYFVPLSIYPAGYHCAPANPLPFVGLASQKNYCSLYLMCLYVGSEVAERFYHDWKQSGKKLDMGKSCLRFRTADDLDLDVIGATLRGISAQDHIRQYEASLIAHRSARPVGKSNRKSESETLAKSAKKKS